MKTRYTHIILIILLLLACSSLKAQIAIGEDIEEIDYANPQEYKIGGITISGVKYLDNNVLVSLSGLSVGDKINVPGEKISKAIEKLWEQGLFENIKISATKIQDNTIFLNIDLTERPRLSKFSFTGLKKSEADDIRDKIKISRGDVVTDNLKIRITNTIKKHFSDKGFLNIQVNIKQTKDTAANNGVILAINVNKNNRVRIKNINLYGNHQISDNKLRKTLKDTKEKSVIKPFYKIDSLIIYNAKSFWKKPSFSDVAQSVGNHLKNNVKLKIFKSSKFIEEDYKKDKIQLIEKYNELGFRDAKIIRDTIYKNNNKIISIDIFISEGRKYFFRNISWVGNTKYTADELNAVLKIKKGDIYNQKVLETNLYMNLESSDVSSLYLDDGYLFFNVTPVEISADNDSIDLEIRINEGKQAIINNVTISGNTRTNDRVIMREIRTKPGELFNRSDIIRTQRELAQLRYFNQEKLGVNPKPNPIDGTVDIEYVVEETSSDQVELSGGWGAGMFVGTLGVAFNNFSTKNFFKKDAWCPLPSGDGQRLSLRFQTNGTYFRSYNASFTEPWFGGKKPNALSFSVYQSAQSNGLPKDNENRYSIKITGVSVGLGKRLKWPDDYFISNVDVTYQNYELHNYYSTFSYANGNSNNICITGQLTRSSVDAPIYPRGGSELSLSLQFTPPYSSFNNKDYTTMTDSAKYRWIEYHKWKFNASWFIRLFGNFVLNTKSKFGFLGLYNQDVGLAPFERFYLGGDGLTGFALDGREIVALRGYANNSLTPVNTKGNMVGGTIFNKYTVELRYPVSLNPMATIYVLGFLEAGNCWSKFNEFNPFDIKRSAGLGIRVFLPMFGLLGLDWGYGFDEIPGKRNVNKGQLHFSIGQSID